LSQDHFTQSSFGTIRPCLSRFSMVKDLRVPMESFIAKWHERLLQSYISDIVDFKNQSISIDLLLEQKRL
jgi:hypothetical protein